MAAASVQKAGGSHLWDSVLEMTKSAQEKKSDPLAWAVQLISALNSGGVSLPSPDLAHLLVSHICWANHVPITWKFLEKALALTIAPPMLVFSLLSTRFLFLHSNLHFLTVTAFSLSLSLGVKIEYMVKFVNYGYYIANVLSFFG